MRWWSVPDAVSRFNFWCQIGTVVFGLTAIGLPIAGGLLAAGAGALSLWASARLAVLTGPRSLTAQQRSALVTALRPAAGDTIEIATVSGDAEAASFAAEIRDVFSAAGWQIYRGEIQACVFHNPISGLIMVTGNKPPTQLDLVVLEAFRSVGLPIEGDMWPPSRAGRPLEIVVAHKR